MFRDQIVKRTSAAVLGGHSASSPSATGAAAATSSMGHSSSSEADKKLNTSAAIGNDDDVEVDFSPKKGYPRKVTGARYPIGIVNTIVHYMTSSSHFDPKTFATIIALSFFTRFYSLTHPNNVVFDEAHFGRYATLYIKGTHFFDIHPPLGKLMFMAASRLIGFDGHFDFHAQYVYDGNFYVAMRTVTAFFSSLTPSIMYLCLLEMGKTNLIAAFAASLVLFDNCILLEGRLILMDAHLLCFISAAYYFHKRRRNAPEYTKEWYVLTALCGVNMALCMSVKWTALATVALIGIETLLELIKRIGKYSDFEQMAKDWCTRGLLLGLFPLCIYLFVWTIHFRLLYHSGPGDNMMPSQFLKRLEGNKEPDDVVPFSLLESIIYLHHRMYEHNKGITEPHMSMSSWWSWPVMLKGMHYWRGQSNDGRIMKIYLMGNPIIWWTALLFVVGFCFYLMSLPWRTDDISAYEKKAVIQGIFLIGGYAMNLYAYILVPRVTFLYHYMPPLYFAFTLEGVAFELLLESIEKLIVTRLRVPSDSLRYYIVGCVLALNVLTFSYFAPLTYGSSLTQEQLSSRAWMTYWE